MQKRLFIFSDFHFNHWDEESQRGIITFERTNFKTIQEHDNHIIRSLEKVGKKLSQEDTIWFLGDFGDLDYLWVIDDLRRISYYNSGKDCTINMILGNHDKIADILDFERYFNNVYQYPVWLSHKLVLSHEPVPVWPNGPILNVHGHLHGAVLDSPNYINASIAVNDYSPVTDKNIAAAFSKLPKYCARFLYEPWADQYKFIQEKEDVLMDKNGNIDLSASRLLQRLNHENHEDDNYNPYTGGL